jgi:hypothetical protein
MKTIFYNFYSNSLSNNNSFSVGKGKLINGDCIEVMKTLPPESVDLLVCSPPYNVNINYDFCNDALMMDDYWNWTELWLTEAVRLLKKDGRVAITNLEDTGFLHWNDSTGTRTAYWIVMPKEFELPSFFSAATFPPDFYETVKGVEGVSPVFSSLA